MLIGDNIVYIELHKTGCTHIRKILSNIPSVNAVIYKKHNTYLNVPSKIIGDFKHKVKIGSIRNPWDWYVSLWAFGCMKQGGLYERLSKRPGLSSLYEIKRLLNNPGVLFQNTGMWKKLYSDYSDPALFQQWLKMIVSSNDNIGEGYKSSKLSNFAGLLTYRYIKLYTYYYKKVFKLIENQDSLQEHDKTNNFIDVMVKSEQINDSLKEYAPFLGIDEKELDKALENNKNKTNKSVRNEYRWYYNDETAALVEKKEKHIIDKYDYQF